MGRSERSTADRPDRNSRARAMMVTRHIAARGIDDERVLRAMAEVPREEFVPPDVAHLSYEDAPLPIGEGQTISQPYVVAWMAAAAEPQAGDRWLEVGTGSGYAAAVFSRMVDRVYTVERHASLAAEAERRFAALGYNNIDVAVRDGTLGWAEHAPYDAIIVAAGAPGRIPEALLEQLAPGGRLIIPRGATQSGQDLIRIRRSADGASLEEDDLGAVRFVPLIGAAGWSPEGERATDRSRERTPVHSSERRHGPAGRVADAMAASAEPFETLETVDLSRLIERIGDARLVLIGEASHGTSEFYRLRARITERLIEEAGFSFVALEADWPDAAEVDAYVRHDPAHRPHRKPFQRFPKWMWANTDVLAFVHWLRRYNESRGDDPSARVGVHGLDLYSLHASMEAVLRYLDEVDPDAAAAARHRYGCLTPWQEDPILYGRAVVTGALDKCEAEVVRMLNELLRKRVEYTRMDGARFVDAIQNARLVVNAEKYYRVMYRGSVASWNLRDQHMFDTLGMLLQVYGRGSRGIVWAHNSHLGDASATDMGARGEHNVGQLVRAAHGAAARLIGFGTHTGTVAAASDWGEPMQIMQVRPSHPRSYEHLAHATGVDNFLLNLRQPSDEALRSRLSEPRLERAIGVIYRPDTELQSHYFSASLPRQFDEWIWFDRTQAVTPIGAVDVASAEGPPDTFPFGV